ncbi:C39 family peptidase [Candidatus Woesearchaeota archaeon]|nr:C39 family peptidase [Candidatus Woesearchaeota archaeon]
MEMPFFSQETDYTCGPACARMMLARFGIAATENELAELLGTTSDSGTDQSAFNRLAEKYGLDYVSRHSASFSELRELSGKGYAVTVCFFFQPEKVSHYAVVSSLSGSRINLLDPWKGPEHNYSTSYFSKLWKHVSKKGRLGCWLFALKK